MNETHLLTEKSVSESCYAADFEVVRGQFFVQSSEPAVTFGKGKMWVNSVCLKKFSGASHIQVLVNSSTKILALRSSREDARDALPWCSSTKGKRKPRKMTCPLFFSKICGLMDWNTACRYRLTGKHLCENGKELLAFDLRLAEAYVYSGNILQQRTPYLPADWRDQFGLPVAKHHVGPMIHVFDEYVTFELERSVVKPDDPPIQESEGGDET